jgi:hypothetical protein
MTATFQAQPTTPAFSLATLRAVLAKGQAAHPELACRMERAALIVIQRRIDPAVAPENRGTGYWVEASDGSKEYWVTLDPRGYRGDRCSCPDYLNRGGPCKHAIAVRLLQACEARERGPEPPPLAFPARTLTDDAPIPFVLTAKGLAATAAVAQGA